MQPRLTSDYRILGSQVRAMSGRWDFLMHHSLRLANENLQIKDDSKFLSAHNREMTSLQNCPEFLSL